MKNSIVSRVVALPILAVLTATVVLGQSGRRSRCFPPSRRS